MSEVSGVVGVPAMPLASFGALFLSNCRSTMSTAEFGAHSGRGKDAGRFLAWCVVMTMFRDWGSGCERGLWTYVGFGVKDSK